MNKRFIFLIKGMSLPIRLADSGLSKARQNQLKDSFMFEREDSEYDVYKRGGTFYISRKLGTVTAPEVEETETKTKPKPDSKPKPKEAPNDINISGRDILDQYVEIRKLLADEKRKRQKYKTKFNSLHNYVFGANKEAPAENHIDTDQEANQNTDYGPEFVLKSRRR